MTVEIFSLPNLHERMCWTLEAISDLLVSQAVSLPIELQRLVNRFMVEE